MKSDTKNANRTTGEMAVMRFEKKKTGVKAAAKREVKIKGPVEITPTQFKVAPVTTNKKRGVVANTSAVPWSEPYTLIDLSDRVEATSATAKETSSIHGSTLPLAEGISDTENKPFEGT
jgi:hypothetical protein